MRQIRSLLAVGLLLGAASTLAAQPVPGWVMYCPPDSDPGWAPPGHPVLAQFPCAEQIRFVHPFLIASEIPGASRRLQVGACYHIAQVPDYAFKVIGLLPRARGGSVLVLEWLTTTTFENQLGDLLWAPPNFSPSGIWTQTACP